MIFAGGNHCLWIGTKGRDTAARNKAPAVGKGPFVLSEWTSGSHIILKANPNWINPPKLEQIFIPVVPGTQEAAIIAGDTAISKRHRGCGSFRRCLF
jgi:ABC-type transport system substrate-binding protein